MSLNGDVIDLAIGPYRARVAASGASLVSLAVDGRDLVLTFDAASELGVGYLGRTLAPWPNRISDARYSFDGVPYEVPCNERATGAALHGLASFVNWTPRRSAGDEVALGLDLPGSPGYPFAVSLGASYRLDADKGLSVEISARNVGACDAPVGLSVHPYLTCGAGLDDCVLTLPGQQVLLTDERMRPAGLMAVDAGGYDFRTPAPLSGRRVDHAFTGMAGSWAVVLAGPDGRGVSLTSDAPWVQAYSADHPALGRRGLAVEPMTCPPDAFNSDPEVVRLAPGASTVLRYGIRAV